MAAIDKMKPKANKKSSGPIGLSPSLYGFGFSPAAALGL
jgi:hypothetical protein